MMALVSFLFVRIFNSNTVMMRFINFSFFVTYLTNWFFSWAESNHFINITAREKVGSQYQQRNTYKHAKTNREYTATNDHFF